MKYMIRLLVLAAFAFFPVQAIAGNTVIPVTPPMIPGIPTTMTTFSETTETVASIGIRLELGDLKTSVVAGVRYTETDTDNDVTGVMGEVAFPIGTDGGFSPVLRALGIFGNTDVQGVAGVGFDTRTSTPLIGVGAQTDFVDGGVNFSLDGDISPYIGGSSYDGAPERTSNITTNIIPGNMSQRDNGG